VNACAEANHHLDGAVSARDAREADMNRTILVRICGGSSPH